MPEASRVPGEVYTMAFLMAIEHFGNLGTPHTTCKGRGGGESKMLKSPSSRVVQSSSENIGNFWLEHGHICSMYYIVSFNMKSLITAKHILGMGKVIATGNFAKSLAQDAC